MIKGRNSRFFFNDSISIGVSEKRGESMPGKKAQSSSRTPLEPVKCELKVLLVEDQWADQRLISKILMGLGCQVSIAQNLQEAGHLLENKPIEMILLNSSIYSKNGYDFSILVEETERKTGKNIPVIGLDGHFRKIHRDHHMANGMDEYLPKPVSENELFRVMVKLAGRNKCINPPLIQVSADKEEELTAR
jgi:CheY-like chemotaxis protein